MAQALWWCVLAWIRAAPTLGDPSVLFTGMLREQIRGKIMPMFSWAISCWYPYSPLQPPHTRTALLMVWDWQLGPHCQESVWEIPSLPESRHHGGNSCPAEWQGLSASHPRQRGRDLPAGFPLQVVVQPGGVHPLRLLRGLVRAVQPHQPDGAQHGLLPEGLLPSIW